MADREQAILRALFDHEVLLTDWVRVLFFSSRRRTQSSLQRLAEAGLVRFEDPAQPIGVGRAQRRWFLTDQGCRRVAEEFPPGRRPVERGTMPDRMLEHRLGVNRFFVSLVEASLQNRGHGLEVWVAERYHPTMVAGAFLKTDGFGRYHHPGGSLDFYVEYDRGTEWSRQIEEKLFRYVQVAQVWAEGELDYLPNLLVVVPTEPREAAFSKALRRVVDNLELKPSVAAALPYFITREERIEEEGILGRVWRSFAPPPPNRPLAPLFLDERRSLVELPARLAGPYDLSRCLGRRWREKREPVRRPPTFPAGTPPEPLFGPEEPVEEAAQGNQPPEGGEAA